MMSYNVRAVSVNTDLDFSLNLLLSMLAYLLSWSTPKTVWVKFICMKNMNSTFNTEMMKLAGDL